MIIMAMTRNLQNIVTTLVNMSFLGGKGWKKLGFCLGGVQCSIFQNPLLAPRRQNNISLKDFLAGTKNFAELCPLERPEPDEERARTSSGGEDGRPAQWEFTASGESWPCSQVYLQKGDGPLY